MRSAGKWAVAAACVCAWACGSGKKSSDAKVVDAIVDGSDVSLATDAVADGDADDAVDAVTWSPEESKIRKALGIPDEATRVVIFAQNAHLDIDWQHTFQDYYDLYVEQIFLSARKLLDADPDYHYSIAEMAYLKKHVEKHPEEIEPLKKHIARGHLHIVGGGMTSPDTLLPETEVLLRDFERGKAFAKSLGADNVHAAWLPDSFGHAGMAPKILNVMGYDSVFISRIDGALTFAEVLGQPDRPVWKGSHAEYLQQQGSADFVWQSGDGSGSEVLAHWVPVGLYCLGDNMDYDEFIQSPGTHFGDYHGDDPTFVDGKIDGYAQSLEAWGKTPYRFVPVGCDFQAPKEDLLKYLRGYNQRQYAQTGVWTVAASFEEYEALVNPYRATFPVIQGDLTPYFMGFYGSRGYLKQRIRDAGRAYLTAEAMAATVPGADLAWDTEDAEFLLTLTDHHDFVPGTSIDAVVEGEQLPLCATVEAAAAKAMDAAAWTAAGQLAWVEGDLQHEGSEIYRFVLYNPSTVEQWFDLAFTQSLTLPPQPCHYHTTDGQDVACSDPKSAPVKVPPLSFIGVQELAGAVTPTVGVQVTVSPQKATVAENAHVKVSVDLADQFAVTSVAVDGVELLAGRSGTLQQYLDEGGLWRLGQEMPGCMFAPQESPIFLESERDAVPWLHVAIRDALPHDNTTWVDLFAGDVGLRGNTEALTPTKSTTTVKFELTGTGSTLTTSEPGGWVTHPLQSVYESTFWSAADWVIAGNAALLLDRPTGVRLQGTTLELMVDRDAQHEKCDLEGPGGSGLGGGLSWQLVRAESPAQVAVLAQNFNRKVVSGVGLMTVLAAPAGGTAKVISGPQLKGQAVVLSFRATPDGKGRRLRLIAYTDTEVTWQGKTQSVKAVPGGMPVELTWP